MIGMANGNSDTYKSNTVEHKMLAQLKLNEKY